MRPSLAHPVALLKRPGRMEGGAKLCAAIPRLYRRARHGAIRAKHATIARLRFQPFAAAFAIIEELAGVRRHDLDRLMRAMRTSQGRFQLKRRLALLRMTV